MIVIYTEKNNSSCNKALNWFRNNKILFEERRLGSWYSMKLSELINLLSLTSNGFEDVLSYRSAKYKQLKINIQEYTVYEAADLMIKNPELIRKPMIVKGDQLLIGFNSQKIRCFIPGEKRNQQLKNYYFSERNDVFGIIEGRIEP